MQTADLWLLQAAYAGAAGRAWLDVILLITFLGSGWMLIALVPLLFWSKVRARAAALLVTLAVTSGVVASAKALACRVRPCHALGWTRSLPIELPTDPSFPSGHAAGSFAFAAFIFAWNRRAGLALGAVATLVALSRVALGVHYPSDVTAGAILGAALGAIGARVSARAGSSSTVGLADADTESVGQ